MAVTRRSEPAPSKAFRCTLIQRCHSRGVVWTRCFAWMIIDGVEAAQRAGAHRRELDWLQVSNVKEMCP
jgi:hypothetical protein